MKIAPIFPPFPGDATAFQLDLPSETSQPSVTRVLLVSADRALWASINDLLGESRAAAPRFYLDCVADLASCFEIVAQAAPDVVLVDNNLAAPDEFGWLRQWNESETAAPVISLLERPDANLETEILDAGAADCLNTIGLNAGILSRAIHAARARHLLQRDLRAARAQNARLEAAVLHAGLGVMMARYERDENGAVDTPLTFVNPAFERISGYTISEILGRNPRFLQGPDSDADAVRALREAVAAGESLERTMLNYRKDGTPFWNAMQISPVRDQSGAVTDWIGFVSDVSARIEAENALRQSEENLADAQKLTHLGSWLLDLSGRQIENEQLFWSDETFRILGLEPGSVTPSRDFYHALIHPDDRGLALFPGKIVPAGDDLHAQYRILRPDGEERTVQVRATIERDADAAPRRAIGTILDVTERERAEERVREAQRHLHLAMTNAPVMLWALDAVGTVTFVEGQALKQLADRAEGHVGRSIFEIYQSFPAIKELARRALQGEEIGDIIEINNLCFDVKYTPLRDETGAPSGAVGIAHDITAQRSVERALQETQKRLRAVIDAVPMQIWAIDQNGVFTLSEGHSLDAQGRAQEQEKVVGEPIFTLYGEDSPIGRMARRALGGESSRETLELPGCVFEVHYGPTRDDAGAIVGAVGVTHTVTARVRAQRELEQSEARFNRIVANAPGMVYSFRLDPQGQVNFLFVSEGCREIYGLNANYIRENPLALVEAVHPDDFEVYYRLILESERDLSTWNWEGRVRHQDGSWRHVRCQSRPVRQEDGSTVWDGLVMDVTQSRRVQDEVQKSRRALDEAQKLAHIGSFEWNLQSGEITWSNQMFRLFGFERESFTPTPNTLLDLIAPFERENVQRRASHAIETASADSMVIPITRADGEIRWLQTHSRIETDDAGVAILIVGSAQDMTETLQASRALSESEQRYALAAQGANDGLWDWNLERDRIYFSPRWKAMLGFAEDEIGDEPREWLARVHADDIERLRTTLAAHLRGESPHFECEYRVLCANSAYRWMLCRALAVIGESGVATRIAGSQTDISERKAAEAQLSHNAFYDQLTGLPNRTLFLERLERTLTRARRHPEYAFATLFLDIDRFKKINDSLGHLVGDQVLIEASARFASCLRPGDTVARLGGDEFALLVDDINDDDDVPLVAGRIQKELERPFMLDGREIYVTVSIGMAPSRGGEETPDDLLRNADSAMYRAKALGRARSEVFDAAMHQRAVHLLDLEADLWRSIERNQLCLHFQPIISLEGGQISGYEALVRWNHPTRGLVSPAEFIPIAEENGFIRLLGWWVLEEACRQAQKWQAARLAGFPGENPHFMSINLLTRQFSQPDSVEQISQIIRRTGADPRHITLEITESVIMEHSETASAMLRGLKAMGIRLSMDDFGTGYSSLSYLHRFSLDTLKIDRSFISQMRIGARDGEIVNTILALAGGLNMKVVAEGVETAEQLAGLRRMGCGFAQGFLFAKPLPANQIEALWENAPRW